MKLLSFQTWCVSSYLKILFNITGLSGDQCNPMVLKGLTGKSRDIQYGEADDCTGQISRNYNTELN